MVVMFLTYSGYGIMESFKRKRTEYLNGFIKKRVFKTLLHFNLAVLLFFILQTILGKPFELHTYILSMIAYDSIGNSNWFIFDIVVLYLISYIGLLIVVKYKLNTRLFLWYIFSASAIFLIIIFLDKGSSANWWWDTIMCFPMGMLWSAYRESLEKKLQKRSFYSTTLIATSAIFLLTRLLAVNFKYIFFIPEAMAFSFLVILLSMRLKIGNPILNWLGINAFAIYILQRLPMILAEATGLNESPITYFAIILTGTLLISHLFTLTTKQIDKRLFFRLS